MKQQTLIPKSQLKYIKRFTHGGLSFEKRRKVKRPLIPGSITHLVLKSAKANGRLCLLQNKAIVRALLRERARKYFIEILGFVNVGNHLHLKVRFKDRTRFHNFLRTFSGLLARKLTNAHRGNSFGKFWDGLAYTRVLTSKFEELGLNIYFGANMLEVSRGVRARRLYLDKWNRYLQRLKSVRASSKDPGA